MKKRIENPVKTIALKLELEGQGIVNYDGKGQKWMMIKAGKIEKENKRFDNASFAKKDFYYDEDKKLKYKIKISRDALVKSIFRNDIISEVPSIREYTELFYSVISSLPYLVKGFVNAEENKNLNRSSSVMLLDAHQSNSAVSRMELFSRSGEKKINDGSSDSSDNTLYYKETVGEISYKTNGAIDIQNLQLISADPIYDRVYFNPDHFDYFKRGLERTFGEFNQELNYFEFNENSIPEYGLLLNQIQIKFLIRNLIERILKLEIKRKGAYVKIKDLKIKFITDSYIDTFNSDQSWFSINKIEDFDLIDYDVHTFYREMDFEEVAKIRKNVKNNHNNESDEQ